MSAVTIRADRRILVAGLGRLGVHAIQRFLIVGRMAFLAGLVVRAGKLAFGFKVYCGMWVGFDVLCGRPRIRSRPDCALKTAASQVRYRVKGSRRWAKSCSSLACCGSSGNMSLFAGLACQPVPG